jgi:hypothetical protein
MALLSEFYFFNLIHTSKGAIVYLVNVLVLDWTDLVLVYLVFDIIKVLHVIMRV